MSKPTKTFIVTSSQMVEVVKTWEITVPDNEDAQALAYEIAEECGPDSNNHIPVEDIETAWSIKDISEIDKPDKWGNETGSPMYGVPPENDPFWKENDQ